MLGWELNGARPRRWLVVAASTVTLVVGAVLVAPVAWASGTSGYVVGSQGDGDYCGSHNPTCHATSAMSNLGGFNLEAGFEADLGGIDLEARPSSAQGLRTVIQATQYHLSDFCRMTPVQPTVAVNLAEVQSAFVSDGSGDEIADASVTVALGFIDPATNALVSEGGGPYGDATNLLHVAGSQQSSTTGQVGIVWDHAVAGPELCSTPYYGDLGQTVDVVVSVSYSISRGHTVFEDPCAIHVLDACIGPYVLPPNLNPDDMRLSGRVTSISAS